MKYFKKNNQVWAFDDKQIEDGLSENLVELTKEELEDHLTIKTDLPQLTRYQFFRALLENGIKTSTVVEQIETIEDEYTRDLALLGWNDATNFVRTDSSVALVQDLLSLTDDVVDKMWVEALKY